MTMVATAGRKRTIKFNWYNPFVTFETRQDAENAVKLGGGLAIGVQGLGVVVAAIRLVPILQHATIAKDLYAACAGLGVVIVFCAVLTAITLALTRRQAMWAAVVLATLVGFSVVLQLGHGWIALLRLPTLMSISGAILCVRGARALKRQKVDLNEVFS